MKNQTYYTSQEIAAEYENLTQEEKNAVLWTALDYMQQYNGRAKFFCVAMAMGYENDECKSDTWTKM